MRYIITLFWSVLLMSMLTYVVGSMVSAAFNLQTALILGIVSTILIYIIPAILPEGSEKSGLEH